MSLESSFSFMTYNVNYSRRAMNEYAEYSWENRKSSLYNLIEEISPNILFLQEILTKNKEEVQKNLSDYQWHFEPINSRGGLCCNGIGVKNTFLRNVKQQKFSYNFDKFEKTAEKVLGLIIGDLCLLNVHFPINEQSRMAMASNFHRCLPLSKTYKIIIAGDFNAFPDCRGQELLESLQKVTNTVCISDLALSESSREIATRSFKAYPYDVVPESALALPGKLDHIFVKGFKIADKTTLLVLDSRKVVGKSFSPSDHYPIICNLTLDTRITTSTLKKNQISATKIMTIAFIAIALIAIYFKEKITK